MGKENILLLIGENLFFSDDAMIRKLWNTCRYEEEITAYLFVLQDHSMSPIRLYPEEWFVDFNNMQFFQLFRMERTTFNKMVGVLGKIDEKKILQKSYTGGHFPIDIRLQVLIFLWYLATQDTLISIGRQFNVSPVTVMNIVNRVLYFVNKMKTTYIRFPQNEQELIVTARGFENYPGTVGAIDGTHIFLTVEKDQQESYIDRFRRHSISILGICNANKLFTYVFAGFPGSAHDSRVLKNSLFFKEIERHGPSIHFVNEKYHLIGDSAFGLTSWLLTPYRDSGNLTEIQKHHNYCLSSDRVKIEHSFGLLKGRWRRLKFIQTYNVCKAVEIALAACILHNFCILNSDIWDEEVGVVERVINPGGEDFEEGRRKRDQIANSLYNRFNRR